MGRIKGLTPQETRRRIVDGAACAFAAQGYETATIGDIARSAGLSAGALYNHFGSKADLVAAVVAEHVCGDLRATFEAAPSDRVLDLLQEQAVALGRQDRPTSTLLIGALEAGRRDARVRKVLTDTFGENEERLTALLVAAQTAGQVRSDVDPRGVAHLMYTLLLGSLAQSLLDEPASTAPRSAWVSAVDDVFAGIRAAPATPRTRK